MNEKDDTWAKADDATLFAGAPSPHITYSMSGSAAAIFDKRMDEVRRKWREAKRRQRAAKKGEAYAR